MMIVFDNYKPDGVYLKLLKVCTISYMQSNSQSDMLNDEAPITQENGESNVESEKILEIHNGNTIIIIEDFIGLVVESDIKWKFPYDVSIKKYFD